MGTKPHYISEKIPSTRKEHGRLRDLGLQKTNLCQICSQWMQQGQPVRQVK